MAQQPTVEEIAARLKIRWVPQDPDNPNPVDPLGALAEFAVALYVDQEKKRLGGDLSDEELLERWAEEAQPAQGAEG